MKKRTYWRKWACRRCNTFKATCEFNGALTLRFCYFLESKYSGGKDSLVSLVVVVVGAGGVIGCHSPIDVQRPPGGCSAGNKQEQQKKKVVAGEEEGTSIDMFNKLAAMMCRCDCERGAGVSPSYGG